MRSSTSARWMLALFWLLAPALAVLPVSTEPVMAGRDKAEKRAVSQLKLGHTLYEAGRLGEALTAVRKALKEKPKYVQAHLLRGMILFQMDAIEDALAAFDKTLRLKKDYTDARNWKAFALVQLERYEEAMQEYERALEERTYPNPEKIHCNIGMLHRLQGNSDAALESLQRAVNLNQSYARGYYELGITYDQLGRDKDALKAYQDARVGLDDDPTLNLHLGLALLKTGDGPGAKEHFEKVIKLAPDDSDEAEQARDQIAAIEKGHPAS